MRIATTWTMTRAAEQKAKDIKKKTTPKSVSFYSLLLI